jgi:hypothetical protein
MVEECFGIEFDLTGGRGEAAELAGSIRLGVFAVPDLQRHSHTPGRGPQFLQSHPGGSKLMAIGSVYVAVPELIGADRKR